MITVLEFMVAERGLPPGKESYTWEEIEKHGMTPVVACYGCDMTMNCFSASIGNDGAFYCEGCAKHEAEREREMETPLDYRTDAAGSDEYWQRIEVRRGERRVATILVFRPITGRHGKLIRANLVVTMDAGLPGDRARILKKLSRVGQD